MFLSNFVRRQTSMGRHNLILLGGIIYVIESKQRNYIQEAGGRWRPCMLWHPPAHPIVCESLLLSYMLHPAYLLSERGRGSRRGGERCVFIRRRTGNGAQSLSESGITAAIFSAQSQDNTTRLHARRRRLAPWPCPIELWTSLRDRKKPKEECARRGNGEKCGSAAIVESTM